MKNIFLLVVISVLFQSSAYAGLLIAPLRVVFDQNERSKVVTIINSGQKSASYRIGFKNLEQLPSGEYKEIKNRNNVNASQFFANKMIRFSPRQVSLNPGDRQQIRISLRKPNTITAGEYRSHLTFTQLPEPEMLPGNNKSQGIKVFMLTSFSIPVQVRHGNPEVHPQITDAKLTHLKTDQWQIETTIHKESPFSSFGKIVAYWRESSGHEYTEIDFIDNATLYREVSNRTINLVIDKDDVKTGQYKVVYVPDSVFLQSKFDQFEFSFTKK